MTVSEHPVVLVVGDDLERDRFTVFFRAIFAIPLFIWLSLWSLLALAAAIANWLCTLIRGRSPARLHRFLAAFVKYATQVYAYLYLAANPYPSFDGQDGYPVDVTIASPARQSRWSVALRIVLLLPAALLAGALVGDPSGGRLIGRGSSFFNIGLLWIVAFLGWFAIIARGRMPRGLRDAAAYALCYGAQFWAYALLLTDRYPDSDPLAALGEVAPRAHGPVQVSAEDDLRRSRLTVFFRLPLAVPHLVVVELWGVLALLGAIVNWLATLLTGRSPAWLHGFLAAYVRYQMRVTSFVYLVANPFPGFGGRAGDYPAFEGHIAERERQNRWKSGFRALLALPALALGSAYSVLALVVALLGWFSSLVRGRMPRGLRNAGALALRYQAQLACYALLLTDVYPHGGPTRESAAAQQPEAMASSPAPPGAVGPD
jgi:hypothetical protein